MMNAYRNAASLSYSLALAHSFFVSFVSSRKIGGTRVQRGRIWGEKRRKEKNRRESSQGRFNLYLRVSADRENTFLHEGKFTRVSGTVVRDGFTTPSIAPLLLKGCGEARGPLASGPERRLRISEV